MRKIMGAFLLSDKVSIVEYPRMKHLDIVTKEKVLDYFLYCVVTLS